MPRTGSGATYSYADVGEGLLAHYLIDYIGVRLPRVRRIVEQLRDRYGAWPLSTAPLEHDGPFIVVRDEDLVFSAEQPEQGVLERTLDLRELRTALAHGGWVTLARPHPHVEVNPERLGGRPTVRGRRIPTAVVVDIAERPGGARTLRDEYDLTQAEIADALSYEHEVREALAA